MVGSLIGVRWLDGWLVGWLVEGLKALTRLTVSQSE